MQRRTDELDGNDRGRVDGLEVALDRVSGEGVRPLRMPELSLRAGVAGYYSGRRHDAFDVLMSSIDEIAGRLSPPEQHPTSSYTTSRDLTSRGRRR